MEVNYIVHAENAVLYYMNITSSLSRLKRICSRSNLYKSEDGFRIHGISEPGSHPNRGKVMGNDVTSSFMDRCYERAEFRAARRRDATASPPSERY